MDTLTSFGSDISDYKLNISVSVKISIIIVLILAINKDSTFFVNAHGNFIISAILDCIFGIAFALAMAVSNMTKLSATISFLDLRYWNPALAFIMGGAISINAPLQYLITNKGPSKPFLGTEFTCPKFNKVDFKLILGSIIFGVGYVHYHHYYCCYYYYYYYYYYDYYYYYHYYY